MDQHPDISSDEPLDQTPVPSSCPSCDEYMAGWNRAQADYQNLTRDVDRERGEMRKYANERLLSELLPAIDQFSIALRFTPDTSTLPDDQSSVWENWLTGIRAVQSLWEQAASGVGLERVPTEGVFNPALHDAAGEEDGQDKPSGTILKVLQDGWRLHGKVLRPARVVVVK
mgnify:FL=1